MFRRAGAVIARQQRYRIDGDGGVTRLPPGAAWAPKYVVLSRSLVRHTFLDASPDADRDDVEAAAANIVAGYGVFANPGQAVEKVGSKRYRIWYWDHDRVTSCLDRADLSEAHFSLVPEPLLTAASNEVELVRTADGFEGRVWRNGDLVSTLWWPEEPNAGQWTSFLRGAGREPEGAPSPSRPIYVAGPRRGRDLFTDVFGRFRPAVWVCAALAALLVPIVYQAGAVVRLALSEQSLQRRLTAAEEPLGDYRTFRAEALQAASEIERLSEFAASPSVGAMLAAVSDPLISAGLEPVTWRHRPDELTLEVEGDPSTGLAQLVSAIDEHERLQNASVRRERNERLSVSAEIIEDARP